MGPAAAVIPNVRAEQIQCALQDRVLGLGVTPGTHHWRGILLASGSGVVTQGNDSVALSAPCLGWLPWREGQVFRIKAGCVGYQIAISDQLLGTAIGHDPESADLRYFLDRQVIAPLHDTPETLSDAEHAFDLIVREIHRPRTGSWTMVQAQVRAVLVLLWRTSGAGEVVLQAQGQSSRILQHFRQLLERHFRERWAIRTYCDSMGVSPDRLHDICQRELGRTPLQLVHERVIYEARLRLERSTQTVDQVAGSLGFRDVGHFSRFFKSKAGLPPGAYRDQVLRAAREGAGMQNVSYSDWP